MKSVVTVEFLEVVGKGLTGGMFVSMGLVAIAAALSLAFGSL